LLLGRALWITLMITVLLTGYSYIQALNLYSEASRSALKIPELARGISPLDGILVPTLGSLYLAATFLFPFIVIRTVGAEKQVGAHKLLIQLPYSMSMLFAAKLLAALVAWIAMLLPSLAAMALWMTSGGHIHGPEAANLILGHFLYAFVIAGISLAAATLTKSAASAAITALAAILGFWVLDFAGAGGNGVLGKLAGLSLTAVLHTFERGVFSLRALMGSLVAGLGLMTVAGIWFHPGQSVRRRARNLGLLLSVLLIASGGVSQIHFFRDTTEDRRNSFSASDEAALHEMKERLTIKVYLAVEDPRLYDLEHSILGKLQRTLCNVEITFPQNGVSQIPIGGSDRYGQVIYRYAGHQAMSRSTSEEEVLPLIFELAGQKQPPSSRADRYPGYPLVADGHRAGIWFYWVFPVVLLALAGITFGSFWKRIRW